MVISRSGGGPESEDAFRCIPLRPPPQVQRGAHSPSYSASKSSGSPESEAARARLLALLTESSPRSQHRTSEQQGKDEREPPMSLRKLAERSSLTDWLLAAFTFVLAA